MKPSFYAGHRITQQGLVIRSEQSEIIIPLAQAAKLLSAVERATSEPPEQEQRGMQRNALRRMKLT